MRRFDDHEGRSWEVVAGRESWGALVAIFIPVEGLHDPRDAKGEVTEGIAMRQAPLTASSYEAATSEFDRMDDGELRDLLLRSEPKTF